LFSSISGFGLKGDREKRRKEASCGEMPARAIRSYNTQNNTSATEENIKNISNR
jgi:hypothetical protein